MSQQVLDQVKPKPSPTQDSHVYNHQKHRYRNRDKVDFLVRNHGTVWTIVPQTEAAKEWTAENVEIEDWQRMGSGSGFTGDHRPMRHLVEAIEAEGFSVERG